jgi:hypothetical protein
MCETFAKNSLLLSEYSLDMTKTVFPTFQTQYILNFSWASGIVKHWDLTNTKIFQSEDVASVFICLTMAAQDFGVNQLIL